MSVDLIATVPGPIALTALLRTAHDVLGTLPAALAPPALTVAAPPGTLLGERLSAHSLDLIADGYRERTSLLLLAHRPEDPVELSASPTRTCVGVVLAAAIALAAAIEGHGEFIAEIPLLPAPITDPHRFIERTRLHDPGEDFATQCEKYLRGLPNLKGRPTTRRLAP
ncbi:hypothetical protein [Actinomadura parmotrematis]|uniref:Uncharacterized protein n=1 Tax=Actinomadura parmotrematis TaxID=2864039 RepID=A0ABS7FUD0_9ACTN|nr:hypothetical protein [Actinomadura parmotrematis]MBW8484019.1 hypothetical protein [Actinomadura parmotrematis]